jgi:peptide/nickel transport system substrate-binding protein
LLAKVSTTRDFDSSIYNGFQQFPDPDMSLYFASANAAPGGLNGGGYKSREVDQLLQQAASTVDKAKRKEIYFKIQDILNEDAPSIPMSVWNGLWIRNKRVQNFGSPTYLGPGTFTGPRPGINQVWVSDGK